MKDLLINALRQIQNTCFQVIAFVRKKVNGGKNEEANRHCPLNQKSAKTLFTNGVVHMGIDGQRNAHVEEAHG